MIIITVKSERVRAEGKEGRKNAPLKRNGERPVVGYYVRSGGRRLSLTPNIRIINLARATPDLLCALFMRSILRRYS